MDLFTEYVNLLNLITFTISQENEDSLYDMVDQCGSARFNLHQAAMNNQLDIELANELILCLSFIDSVLIVFLSSEDVPFDKLYELSMWISNRIDNFHAS